MPYIGRPLNAGNLAVQSGTGDGSDTTPIATLDYSVGSSNSIGVYLDGVRQLAGTDFTASGTTLTFTTAPANSVGIDVYFLGLELSLPTPADASVTAAKLASDAVTGAKIADDAIDSEHYTDGSIDLAHMSSESVDEDNLHISNAGSNGQFLSKQSGNAGGLTWAAAGGGNKVLYIPLLEGAISHTYNDYGTYRGILMADGASTSGGNAWSVPDDFTSLTSIKLWYRATGGSGNMAGEFLSAATAPSEANSADTDSMALNAYTVPDADLNQIDCTAMANGLTFTAGHLISLQFFRRGANVYDTLSNTFYVFGFEVTYQ